MTSTQEVSSVRLVLARSIQELRKLRGVTQEELSTSTGITRSHISAIEHGRCNIRLDNIDKIARALGVPLRQLFDERGDEVSEEQHPPFYHGESSGWYRVINPPAVSMRLSGIA